MISTANGISLISRALIIIDQVQPRDAVRGHEHTLVTRGSCGRLVGYFCCPDGIYACPEGTVCESGGYCRRGLSTTIISLIVSVVLLVIAGIVGYMIWNQQKKRRAAAIAASNSVVYTTAADPAAPAYYQGGVADQKAYGAPTYDQQQYAAAPPAGPTYAAAPAGPTYAAQQPYGAPQQPNSYAPPAGGYTEPAAPNGQNQPVVYR
ncbi:hypothetical protein HDU67_010406 [Dinochytrium kinnereticum]|nr:hypothetical protein HDU67_010406 [Dinochytrium kinnereticum]